MQKQRIDKIISEIKCISRADVKKIIRSGRVKIDGETVKSADFKVDAECADIYLDGEKIEYKKYVYIMMNKPENTVCTNSDEGESVIDILPPALKRSGLFTVGRLDKDTTGLLIITNDGDFAHKVISPKKDVEKCYRALLTQPLGEAEKSALEKGVTLSDGTALKGAAVEYASDDKREIFIKITEGKYHQVKRMLAAVGNRVTALSRISIGELALDADLLPGQARECYESELNMLLCKSDN